MPKERKKSLCMDALRHAEYYGMQQTFDTLYAKSKAGEVFTGLMEQILNQDNIMLAYRNIKANAGSYTAGTDKQNIGDIGRLTPGEVINKVRKIVTGSEHGYRPKPVRRKEIPKPNGKTRPLGIPCIWDRLVQQCIKQILEPICEAKFSNNSYGFRPNRSVEHAISRTYSLLQRAHLHYVLEFDIKGFFDNVNHSKLIKQLWTLGIQDKRLLFVIKRILKAPIRMPDGSTDYPEKGTPQGGIISPLLANVVLNELDHWIDSQWTEHPLANRYGTRRIIRTSEVFDKSKGYKKMRDTSLKEMFIVRYADDFRIFCRNREDEWKRSRPVLRGEGGREPSDLLGGELIFRLVYDYCKCTKPVERLWISSMEDSAIRDGFAKLRPGAEYERLYEAALCRSQADWLVGINATRLFSCLYGVTLNVGRVQTPTLAMLVSREAEIGAFVKKPFYTPEFQCGDFMASGARQTDKTAADSIRAACNGKTATVRSVTRQEKSIAPPKLYDLTTLQREANRLFGYTAQQTLDYAQELYEQKLITYPRTDSRFLTGDMAAGLPALVSSVAEHFDILPGAVNAAQVVDDSKVSDHHALIPTPTAAKCDVSALGAGHQNILRLLAVRLVCAVGERHLYAETAVTVDCEGHSFQTKGRMVLQEGWRTADRAFKASLKEKPKEDDETVSLPDGGRLPELTEGQTFPSVIVTVREGFTSPPKRFSEDTLLQSMETAGAADMPEDAERKGLGTPATRAGVIEKLVKSGFLERKAKQLLPTDKGRNLIAVLPDTVKSPLLTAEWEHRLGEVERGELSSDTFIGGIADQTRALVQTYTAPEKQFQALFTKPAGAVVGKCPRCGSDVCENKKGFFCAVPSCGFALWRDNKFFAAKKKVLDKKTAAALLAEGRVFLSGLYSERTGKTYDATVILEDTGKYANFKLDFGGK